MVAGTIYRHRYGWVVIFKAWKAVAPEFARAVMAIIDFASEFEVDSCHVVREDGCARSDSQVK